MNEQKKRRELKLWHADFLWNFMESNQEWTDAWLLEKAEECGLNVSFIPLGKTKE